MEVLNFLFVLAVLFVVVVVLSVKARSAQVCHHEKRKSWHILTFESQRIINTRDFFFSDCK